jgi:hypothetical protein
MYLNCKYFKLCSFYGVQKPIIIERFPSNFVLNTSVSAAVICNSVTPLTYIWYRNGSPIPGNNRPTLYINSLSPATTGVYRCEVLNYRYKTISSSFTVKV